MARWDTCQLNIKDGTFLVKITNISDDELNPPVNWSVLTCFSKVISTIFFKKPPLTKRITMKTKIISFLKLSVGVIIASYALIGCHLHKFPGTKSTYEIQVNNVNREYIVYEPSHYGAEDYPLVFMFHGASGTGERFYDRSGWNDVAETDSFLVAYPTGWPYDMSDDGCGGDSINLWHDYNVPTLVCDPSLLLDDVHFFDQMLDEIITNYNVDTSRIYIAGFSNGGGMTGRLSVEVSNRLAAIGPFAGTLEFDSSFVPQRNLPIHLGIGNKDPLVLAMTDFTDSIPMDMGIALSDSLLHNVIMTWANTFELDTNYTITTSTPLLLTATFDGLSGDSDHVFHFTLVNDVYHQYPNPDNAPGAAEFYWNFFKKHTLN